MLTDARDTVLGDFGSVDMLATRCCSYNASYNICRGRQTILPAAVLRKFRTSTHRLNCLACARSNDRPGKRQEAGDALAWLFSSSCLSFSHLAQHLASSRSALRVPPHYAVHLLSGSRYFKHAGLSAVTQGPGNHSSCARWVAGTGCALPYMDRRWRKRKPCTGSTIMLHWRVGGSHRDSGIQLRGRGAVYRLSAIAEWADNGFDGR